MLKKAAIGQRKNCGTQDVETGFSYQWKSDEKGDIAKCSLNYTIRPH